jgi:phage tail-like protein
MAAPVLSSRSDSLTEDPLASFNFVLELEGALAGYFTEVSGIGSENEIIEHKVVDPNGKELVQKFPGRLKFEDVSLKRGITSDMKIWEWRQLVVEGSLSDARKNCTITMLDRAYQPVAIWHFLNAWPSKVTGPSLNAEGNDVGVEEITITHEGMYREK